MPLVRFYVDVPPNVGPENMSAGSCLWHLCAWTNPGTRIEGYKRYSFDVDLPMPEAEHLPLATNVTEEGSW